MEHPEYGEVLQLQGDQVSILMATAALKSLTILQNNFFSTLVKRSTFLDSVAIKMME